MAEKSSTKSVQKQPNKSLLAIVQSAQFRDVMFAVVLLLVEFVLALRYGADTYSAAIAEHLIKWPYNRAVILAGLDVALIDGVFIAMLVLAKYSGQSAKATKIRPFVAVGAAIMFLVMLSVAVEAMSILVAARWAGGILMSYIMSDIFVDLLHKFQAWNRSRVRDSDSSFHDRLFSINRVIGDMVVSLLTAPFVWVIVGWTDTKRAVDLHFLKVAQKTRQTAPILTTALSTANREQIGNENIVLLNQKRSMEKAERRAEISAYIAGGTDRSDTELCQWVKDSFSVSESTARGDLRSIKAGTVNHG